MLLALGHFQFFAERDQSKKIGGCAQRHTHPKRRSSARSPASCRSVHPVCMTAYLHMCLVSRSHSICTAAADMSMAAQSMLLLIRADTDAPPVRTPCPHVNHISVSCPHTLCLSRPPAVLCFALNPFPHRVHVLDPALPTCSAPRPSTTPTHQVCVPSCPRSLRLCGPRALNSFLLAQHVISRCARL